MRLPTPLHPMPIPFITLPNWVKAAAQCGFNIAPIFREVGIDTDLIHLESATVEAPLLQQVMEACVARPASSGQHFPFVLGETFAFDYLPDIDTFLATSPSLREAFRVFEWVRELINPLIRVDLRVAGDEAQVILNLGDGPAAEGPTVAYFREATFASIVKFGRRLLGPDASFLRLELRHARPAHGDAYTDYFRVPVLFGRPDNLLALDAALLDRPLDGTFPTLHRQAEYRVEQRLKQVPFPAAPAAAEGSPVAAIEQAFAAQPALLGQGIERMAAALGLHPRTLQRRLADGGHGYAELQDRARFRLATALLGDRALDLETISERLGCSDRRSFTRAFSRWAGCSPSAFRERGRG
jgi:AraC-like DNA-binding protein